MGEPVSDEKWDQLTADDATSCSLTNIRPIIESHVEGGWVRDNE